MEINQKKMSDFTQNIVQGFIVIGVLGTIAIIYYSKLTKQSFSEVVRKLFSMKFFESKEEAQPKQEDLQTWQQKPMNQIRM